MIKRFVCHGGYIRSPNDGDRHWISPVKVSQLNHIDPRECIFVYEANSLRGYSDEYLNSLLHLHPMTNWYSPVSPAERRQYPIV